MDDAQKLFLNYIMDRVKPENKDRAAGILLECFTKQAAGALDDNFLGEVGPKIIKLLKPEAVFEVQAIMTRYVSQVSKKR